MDKDYIHIILADDDEDDRMLFTDAFGELRINTKVNTFNDGVELMDYLNAPDSILPNVLFLDLNMPKKNGIECLYEIKQDARFNDIAIAIFSDLQLLKAFLSNTNCLTEPQIPVEYSSSPQEKLPYAVIRSRLTP